MKGFNGISGFDYHRKLSIQIEKKVRMVTSWLVDFIRKTCPCNEYPLKPHFYIVTLGFAGVYLFFLFLLMSTHNLCFGAKIRKIGIPLHTPVLLYKSGVQGGILFTDMFS